MWMPPKIIGGILFFIKGIFMEAEQLLLFLLCSISLLSFFIIVLSSIRFFCTSSITEKFGILFVDTIVIISIIFYLIFAVDLFIKIRHGSMYYQDNSVYVHNST